MTSRAKKMIFFVTIIVILFFVFKNIETDVVVRFVNNVSSDIDDNYQRKLRSQEYEWMHKKKIDLSGYSVMEDEPGKWYTKYHFISHAGGGIDGKTYTNSIQAWNLSYEKGNRVFDVDLAFTTDGVLVLRHHWDDNLEQGVAISEGEQWVDDNGMPRNSTPGFPVDYETFKKTKIYYQYDSMSCEDMLNYMAKHEDLYIACDMKDDILSSYGYLVNLAKEMQLEEVLKRVIVNLYDYDSYESIMQIYNFENVTVRQHAVAPNNYYELVEFCLKNNIHVVNVSKCYIEDEGVQLLESYGIHVYIAIADYISDMKKYYALGITGAVTNYLYEPDWMYISN